jgi:hypothetical protein
LTGTGTTGTTGKSRPEKPNLGNGITKQSHVSEKLGKFFGRLLPIGRAATDLPGVVGANLGGLLVLALNGFVNLAPMNRNFARRLDSQSYFVAADIDNGYDDIVAYDDAFVALAGEDKHDTSIDRKPRARHSRNPHHI